MIKNGANTPLNLSTGTLPQVGAALLDWFQNMVFVIVTTEVIDFVAQQVGTPINFRGVWQPLSPQKLMVKPEGQRNWKWFMLHSDTTLDLENDDVVQYLGVQYRVMAKNDYGKYGYFEYHLVNDYSGSGPEMIY